MILFPENRSRVGSNLFGDVGEISFNMCPKSLREFKSKEGLGKFCVLNHEGHHWQPR
jgi:hypothetical protein